MRSKLFAIRPANLFINKDKLPAEVEQHWGICWDDEKNLKKVPVEFFKDVLEDAKIYGYFVLDYTLMLEKLFRSIMEQNPQATNMEWHFDCEGEFVYCLSIKREDMDKKYAVQLTLSHEKGIYYTVDPKDSEYTMLDKDTYLKYYPNHMKPTTQMVDLETHRKLEMAKRLFFQN